MTCTRELAETRHCTEMRCTDRSPWCSARSLAPLPSRRPAAAGARSSTCRRRPRVRATSRGRRPVGHRTHADATVPGSDDVQRQRGVNVASMEAAKNDAPVGAAQWIGSTPRSATPRTQLNASPGNTRLARRPSDDVIALCKHVLRIAIGCHGDRTRASSSFALRPGGRSNGGMRSSRDRQRPRGAVVRTDSAVGAHRATAARTIAPAWAAGAARVPRRRGYATDKGARARRQ